MGFVIQMAPGKAEAHPAYRAYSGVPTTQPGAIWARIPRPRSARQGLGLTSRVDRRGSADRETDLAGVLGRDLDVADLRRSHDVAPPLLVGQPQLTVLCGQR